MQNGRSVLNHWLLKPQDAQQVAARAALLLHGTGVLDDAVEAARSLVQVGTNNETVTVQWTERTTRGYGGFGSSFREATFGVYLDETGMPAMKGSCSCRAQGCEHMGAGLVRLLMEQKRDVGKVLISGPKVLDGMSKTGVEMMLRMEGSELAEMLASEASAGEKERGVGKETKHVVYVLSSLARGIAGTLKLKAMGVLKSGEYSQKETTFGWSQLEGAFRGIGAAQDGQDWIGDHADAGDLEVGRELFMKNSLPGSSAMALNGAKLGNALDLMVRTGRVRMEWNQSTKLSMGEPRKAEAVWERTADGKWSLSAKVEGDGVFVPTDPPWYVSGGDGKIGRLTGKWPAMTLQLMRGGTGLEDSDLAAIRKHIATIPGAQENVPKPPEIVVVDGGTIKPVPELVLKWLPVDSRFDGRERSVGSSVGAASAALTFDYLGVRVEDETGTSIVVWDKNVKTVYKRDKAFERNCLRLIALKAVTKGIVGFEVQYGTVDYHDEKKVGELIKVQKEVVPVAASAGWRVSLSSLWPGRFVTLSGIEAQQGEESKGWLDFEMSASFDGQTIDMLELLQKAAASPEVMSAIGNEEEHEKYWQHTQQNGYVVKVKIQELAGLLPLVQAVRKDEKTGRYRISKFDIGAIEAAERATDTRLANSAALVGLAEALRNAPTSLPERTANALMLPARTWQSIGAGYCDARRAQGMGCIVSDEYAVGKTLEILLTIFNASGEAEGTGKPSLIVVTKTLFYERRWQEERDKFLPTMELIEVGTGRQIEKLAGSRGATAVITTYDTMVRYLDAFKPIEWNVIAADEAHKLGNHATNVYRAMDVLNARQKLPVTGSPMQNQPREMWALMNLAVPGLLRDKAWFQKTFPRLRAASSVSDVEGVKDDRQAELSNRARLISLGKMIGPFVLKRTNAELGRVMPPVNEVTRKVALPQWQANQYEAIRVMTRQKVDTLLVDTPLHQSKQHIFSMLTALRQVCCDPRLIKAAATAPAKRSAHAKAAPVRVAAKVRAMSEVCDEFTADGKKIVIASSWTEWLHLIRDDLEAAGYGCSMMTGRVTSGKKRAEESRAFRQGDKDVMLMQMSLGEGIELPEADCIIIAEPWWNRKKEEQAIARLRRDERNKTITVVRLVVPKSVEGGVMRVAENKLDDIEAVNEGHASGARALSMDDVEAFFSIPDQEDDDQQEAA